MIPQKCQSLVKLANVIKEKNKKKYLDFRLCL